MKKSFGFTLSEVLIAMIIIGVVSAIVVPRVAGDATKKQFTTKFKTTMNLLQGAASEYKAQEGGFDYTGNKTFDRGLATIPRILLNTVDAEMVKNTNESAAWTMKGNLPSTYEQTSANIGGTSGTVATSNLMVAFNTTPLFGVNDEDDVQACAFSTDGSGCGNADYLNLQLKNGAHIYIHKDQNLITCNLRNVRWDSTSKTYLTPNPFANTTNINLCLAFVDVNGRKGPNRLTTCVGDAITSPYSDNHCFTDANKTPTMTYSQVGDIFPIFFYDASVAPATRAGYSVIHDVYAD